MTTEHSANPDDVNLGAAEGRQEQTNAAGHTIDTTFCAICGNAPCNKEEEYWGVCPVCHHSPHWLNIGADHWCYCPQHRVKWFVGERLFSCFMYETTEEQKAKSDTLNFGSYTEVDDVPRPHSDYTPEQLAADRASDGPFIDELGDLSVPADCALSDTDLEGLDSEPK
jgi:hypothetical protein